MDVSLLHWSDLSTAQVLRGWQFKVKSATVYLALALHTLERAICLFFYPSLLFIPSFLPSLLIIIIIFNVLTIKRLGSAVEETNSLVLS